MRLATLIARYKTLNGTTWLDWVFRVFFSAEFLQTFVAIPAEDYPTLCWAMLFLATWCYFLRLKLLGFVPLIYCVLFHYWQNP